MDAGPDGRGPARPRSGRNGSARALRTIETLSLRYWDFVFVVAALAGLYPLHRLSLVEEEGEVEERAVLQALSVEMGRAVRNLSSVTGLRAITAFPMDFFRRVGDDAAQTDTGI